MEEGYIPVPVEAAREIAEKYGKSMVIISAWDPVHGHLHTTTYGRDPQEKAWAAQGGEIASKALGGVRELSTDFEDYRLQQAHKLLVALKEAVACAYENDLTQGPDSWLAKARVAIADAEKFLGSGVPDTRLPYHKPKLMRLGNLSDVVRAEPQRTPSHDAAVIFDGTAS